MDMRPFKVTITFAAPVMLDSDYPLHLDSYLAWARVNEEEEKGAINPWPAGDDLPLIKAGQGFSLPYREAVEGSWICRTCYSECFSHVLLLCEHSWRQ